MSRDLDGGELGIGCAPYVLLLVAAIAALAAIALSVHDDTSAAFLLGVVAATIAIVVVLRVIR